MERARAQANTASTARGSVKVSIGGGWRVDVGPRARRSRRDGKANKNLKHTFYFGRSDFSKMATSDLKRETIFFSDISLTTDPGS